MDMNEKLMAFEIATLDGIVLLVRQEDVAQSIFADPVGFRHLMYYSVTTKKNGSYYLVYNETDRWDIAAHLICQLADYLEGCTGDVFDDLVQRVDLADSNNDTTSIVIVTKTFSATAHKMSVKEFMDTVDKNMLMSRVMDNNTDRADIVFPHATITASDILNSSFNQGTHDGLILAVKAFLMAICDGDADDMEYLHRLSVSDLQDGEIVDLFTKIIHSTSKLLKDHVRLGELAVINPYVETKFENGEVSELIYHRFDNPNDETVEE